ncbi:MAG: ABC transporter ATP-binding protein [Planctomycetota bacterium]
MTHPTPTDPAPILELEGVSKTYRSVQALHDVTVSVRPGAIGLLGPNGAGKSTLIKTLLGLARLTGGQARVLGHDVATESRQIRERVGYMPEDDCAFAGLKGIEAVALAGQLAGLPARVALRRGHEILDYVTVAEERYREVQTYSTGMRQKIKLAQSLIHSPHLVFLDEPTNGLDPRGRERMLGLIRSLTQKKGVSVVLSTHILSDIEACCDAALILGRGRLLVYDSIANLQSTVEESCRVRVEGDAAPLAAALASQGLSSEPLSPNELKVAAAAATAGPQLFAAAQRCGAVVREIAGSRNSLEDIFMTAVRETTQPVAGR